MWTRVALALATTIAVGGQTFAAECTVTKAQYEALRDGIRYEEAIKVLGCPGEELSSSNMAGIKTVMIMWRGAGLGANMNAMFQNGRLISKAQMGLK